MKKSKLKKLQEDNRGKVSGKITYLIGALIVVVLATALAPTMFDNVSNLSDVSSVPTWVPTVLFVIIGAGLVFLIWRSFGMD